MSFTTDYGTDLLPGSAKMAMRASSVKWVPLESSVLASAAYSPGERQLYLEFRSGAVYRYVDVPLQQYVEFLAADSKGRYFNLSIRDRFQCQQVQSQ